MFERAFSYPQQNIYWVAPSYSLAKISWRLFLKLVPSELIEYQNTSELRIEVKHTGSTIVWKSADRPGKGLLGEGLDLCVCDEMAEMKPEVWYEYIRPSLSDRKGKGLFLSRPHGLTWFYQFILDLEKDPDAKVINLPSNSNPFFPPEEWESAKRRLPESIFRQEYMAEFAMGAASVFDHLEDTFIYEDFGRVPGKTFIGMDPGKSRDYCVMTVLDLHRHVLRVKRALHIDWDKQVKMAIALSKEYDADIWVDSHGKEPLYDYLRHSEIGHRVHARPVSSRSVRAELIEALAVDMDPHFTTMPIQIPMWDKHQDHDAIQAMVQELRSMDYRVTSTGEYVYETGVGMHDDCVLALSIANWGWRQRMDKVISVPFVKGLGHTINVSRGPTTVTRKYTARALDKRGGR